MRVLILALALAVTASFASADVRPMPEQIAQDCAQVAIGKTAPVVADMSSNCWIKNGGKARKTRGATVRIALN